MSSYEAFLKGRLVKGFKEVIILKIISEGDVWGYNIVSKIKERYGVKISPSIIYPILSELESKGKKLVEAYHSILKSEIRGG